jgi:hypothetical protein
VPNGFGRGGKPNLSRSAADAVSGSNSGGGAGKVNTPGYWVGIIWAAACAVTGAQNAAPRPRARADMYRMEIFAPLVSALLNSLRVSEFLGRIKGNRNRPGHRRLKQTVRAFSNGRG